MIFSGFRYIQNLCFHVYVPVTYNIPYLKENIVAYMCATDTKRSAKMYVCVDE